MSSFYSLHGLKIEIAQNELSLATNYEHYFRYFKTDIQPEEIDYRIRAYSDLALPRTYLNAGDNFLGLENGVCLPKEKYAITRNGKQITEYTNVANRATNLWLQYLLVNRSLSLIHAAGVELNGKGIIFPAFGGTGKTLLVSELRRLDGVKFFGDDYVIVDENSNMLSYPEDFSIYDYHLELFPELRGTRFEDYLEKRKRLRHHREIAYSIPGARTAERILSYGKSLLVRQPRSSSKTIWDLDYVKVPATLLVPRERIGTRVEIFACIFLSRYTGGDLKLEEVSLNRLLDEIVGILKVEFRYGLLYLHLLSAFGVLDITEFERVQRQVLEKCLSRTRLYRILIPRDIARGRYSEEVMKSVASVVHDR